MGQSCELEMTLAAIRRKKKVLAKNLDLIGLSEDMRNSIESDIKILSKEELKILEQIDDF